MRQNGKDMKEKSRIPHFGPLKGAAKQRKQNQQAKSQPNYNNSNGYGITHPQVGHANLFSINK